MGWAFCQKRDDWHATDYITDHYASDDSRILHMEVTEDAYFLIVEAPSILGDLKPACHTVHVDDTRHPGMIGFKHVPETEGPMAVPPPGFLTVLEHHIPNPPTDFAATWRDYCRDQHQQQAAELRPEPGTHYPVFRRGPTTMPKSAMTLMDNNAEPAADYAVLVAPATRERPAQATAVTTPRASQDLADIERRAHADRLDAAIRGHIARSAAERREAEERAAAREARHERIDKDARAAETQAQEPKIYMLPNGTGIPVPASPEPAKLEAFFARIRQEGGSQFIATDPYLKDMAKKLGADQYPSKDDAWHEDRRGPLRAAYQADAPREPLKLYGSRRETSATERHERPDTTVRAAARPHIPTMDGRPAFADFAYPSRAPEQGRGGRA